MGGNTFSRKQLKRWKVQHALIALKRASEEKKQRIEEEKERFRLAITPEVHDDIASSFCQSHELAIACIAIVFRRKSFAGPIFTTIMVFLTLDKPHAKGLRKKGHQRYRRRRLIRGQGY